MGKLRTGVLTCLLGATLAATAAPLPALAGTPELPLPQESGVNSRAEVAETGADADPATSTYVVRFADDSSSGARSAVKAELDGEARDLSLFPGMIVQLSEAERARLAADPAVAWVQADRRVRAAATQQDAPWGLDRIDQAAQPLDGRYRVNAAGAGVKVYVIDSGIDAAQPDLGNRVKPGVTWVDDGLGSADCNGHGTHVAGTIGGKRFGVAKRVTLVPVRVLDCDGQGLGSATVAAMDWVAGQHRRGTPAVVNLSLVGPKDQALDEAVRRLVADGVTVVVAAGNGGLDACDFSPAAAPEAIAVAAADNADRRASFSNRGRCVDLYAPGVDVVAAAGPDAAGATRSGTSTAAPHVTGVAALLLSRHRTWKPARVAARILALAQPGRIVYNPSGTPDLLLNIAPAVTAANPRKGRTVELTGTGFLGVRRVLFDGVRGTRLRVHSNTRLTVRVPAGRRANRSQAQVVTELSVSAGFAYLRRPAG